MNIICVTGFLQHKMKSINGDACLDIDHLDLGKYKIKKVDANTQTLHLIPYRLRFLPVTDCDVKLGPSENNYTLRCQCCCRLFSQWILSQVGLTIIVVIWALLGALAFFYTEGKKNLTINCWLYKFILNKFWRKRHTNLIFKQH